MKNMIKKVANYAKKNPIDAVVFTYVGMTAVMTLTTCGVQIGKTLILNKVANASIKNGIEHISIE